jgi:hypothetical protein
MSTAFIRPVKKINPLAIVTTIVLFLFLGTCSLLTGIFKLGMEVVMLIVVAMIAVIVVVLVKLRRIYRKQHV